MNRYDQRVANFSYEEIVVVLATVAKFDHTACQLEIAQSQENPNRPVFKLTEISSPQKNNEIRST